MSKSRAAFTLIELLIVIAISAIMSTLAITYSSVGRNQVALSVEEAKLSQFIIQAKQLSISTYTTNGSASCAYGIMIDATNQQYSIFSYGAPSGTCPPEDSVASIDPSWESMYTVGTWQVPVSSGVKINGSGEMAVLFYPPDPTTFLSGDGTTLQAGTLTINLVTIDGKNSGAVSVSPDGQVSFQ